MYAINKKGICKVYFRIGKKNHILLAYNLKILFRVFIINQDQIPTVKHLNGFIGRKV